MVFLGFRGLRFITIAQGVRRIFCLEISKVWNQGNLRPVSNGKFIWA